MAEQKMKIRMMVTMFVMLVMSMATRASLGQVNNLEQKKVSGLALSHAFVLGVVNTKWWATRSPVWACDSQSSALIVREMRKAPKVSAPILNGCQLLKPWTTGIWLSSPVEDILPVAINDGSWLRAWIAAEDIYLYYPETK